MQSLAEASGRQLDLSAVQARPLLYQRRAAMEASARWPRCSPIPHMRPRSH